MDHIVKLHKTERRRDFDGKRSTYLVPQGFVVTANREQSQHVADVLHRECNLDTTAGVKIAAHRGSVFLSYDTLEQIIAEYTEPPVAVAAE